MCVQVSVFRAVGNTAGSPPTKIVLVFLTAFKPKFAEPKKLISETVDKYARDVYERDSYYERPRGMHDDRDRDRERMDRRSSGAPGGYPYSDRDRGKRGLL